MLGLASLLLNGRTGSRLGGAKPKGLCDEEHIWDVRRTPVIYMNQGRAGTSRVSQPLLYI